VCGPNRAVLAERQNELRRTAAEIAFSQSQDRPDEHVSKNDPPIGLYFTKQETPPKVGTNQKDPTHSAVMGITLAEKLKAEGVEVILVHQDMPNTKLPSSAAFLIEYLKK